MGKAARRRRHGSASAGTAGGGEGTPSQVHKRAEPTPFQQRVYDLTKAIPAGRVSTYGALAEVLGSAPRAVGQALRNNPFAPVVPCHRVIAASLTLGGFSGSWGIGCASVQKKRAILLSEGVEFDDEGRLLTKGCVLDAARLKAAWAEVAGGAASGRGSGRGGQ